MQITVYDWAKPNITNKMKIGTVIIMIAFRRPIVSQNIPPSILPIGDPMNVRKAFLNDEKINRQI